MESPKTRATGGCHCGAVRFEVRGALRDVIICHCEDCRRIHGHLTAHSAAKKTHLEIIREDGLRWYQSSDKVRRAFCAECGSGLFYDLQDREIISICAGALDGPTGIQTAFHVYTASAADYEKNDGEVPRHDKLPERLDTIPFRD